MKATSCTYRLPGGYSVSFGWDDTAIHCFWSPDMPSDAEMREVLPAYRVARDSFLRTLDLHFAVLEPVDPATVDDLLARSWLTFIRTKTGALLMSTATPKKGGERV